MKFATSSDYSFYKWLLYTMQCCFGSVLPTKEFLSKSESILSKLATVLSTKFMQYSKSVVVISAVFIACSPGVDSILKNHIPCSSVEVTPYLFKFYHEPLKVIHEGWNKPLPNSWYLTCSHESQILLLLLLFWSLLMAVLLPGKSHGWRSLPACEESDMTERLHFHFSLSCFGEGNGNPLQCSCLENPRDARAWWAAVYGVAQSRTRLKWLSSSMTCGF